MAKENLIEKLKKQKTERISEIDVKMTDLNGQLNQIHEQMNLLNEERINLSGGLSTLEQLNELNTE